MKRQAWTDRLDASAIPVKRKRLAQLFFLSRRGLDLPVSETRPRRRLRKMFPRQSDPDAHDYARQKTGEETKPRRVAHRALTQVENPRRFVLVHAAFSIASVRVQADEVILPAELYSVDDWGGAPESGIDIERVLRAFVAVRSASASDHELHRIRQ
jgi:hypothetical protein